MKICWDNLEGMYLTTKGVFVKGNNSYIECTSCKVCGQPYLSVKNCCSEFCSRNCALKNRKFSEETKQKMKDSWKKRGVVTKETRLKQSMARKGLLVGDKNGMYGKTHTNKVKNELSKRMKGNKYRAGILHTKETLEKLSILNSGQNNNNWKGGVSKEPYCIEWTDEYKTYIKERDGNKCLNPDCMRNSNILTVHHINYNKKDCRPNNLITLCCSCNTRANKDRVWHKAWYTVIINKRYNYWGKEDEYSIT